MVVDIPDTVTYTNFGDHRLRGFWVAGGQISPSPIDFHRRPCNTLPLPCERVIAVCPGIKTESSAPLTATLDPAVGHNSVDKWSFVVKFELWARWLATLTGAQRSKVLTSLWHNVIEQLQPHSTTARIISWLTIRWLINYTEVCRKNVSKRDLDTAEDTAPNTNTCKETP